MSNNNYGMGRGFIPTNVAPNYGTSGSYMDIGNYGSNMSGNMSNQFPTPDQFTMMREANVDFMGRPIQPTSFADMSGLQKLSAGLGMAGNLANIWSGIQQNRLARDNFDFQKGVMNTNLANQIASYNTALEDRVAGRYSDRERAANQAEINDYLDRNRAVNRMG